MNRQIRLVGAAVIVLFVALFVQLNYLQVFHASALDNNPLNGSRVVREYTTPRGQIVSADGQTLATSVPTNDQFKYLREYPQKGLFADITGFYSFTYGAEGAERTYDSILTGANLSSSLPTSIQGLKDLLTQTNKAQSITLTVSEKMQQAAATALAGRAGTVVAIEPATGAILAMYSNPTYDPNLLSGHSQTQVMANYKSLVAAAGNPLSPGAYRNTWPPGSTFKILTSSAVYDHDPTLATKTYPVLNALQLPQTSSLLHNFAGETCGGQLLALFTVSCNSGFGAVGLDLGGQNLYDEAHAFGFDQTPPLDLPAVTQARFPTPSTFAQNQPAIAYSAIGQENVSSTPLEMALVASAIADNGTIMTPHILDHVTNSQGRTVSTYTDKPWLQATSAPTAGAVTQLMLSVVNAPDGTGGAARIPGVQVAAKTGTAQTGHNTIDAWFAAFAPVPNPTIAVAVLLPDQPNGNAYQGGTLAAPVAKAVIQAWLASGAAKATPVTSSSAVTSPTTTATSSTTTPSTTPSTATVPTVTTPIVTAPSVTAPPATSPATTAPPARAPSTTAPAAAGAPASSSPGTGVP